MLWQHRAATYATHALLQHTAAPMHVLDATLCPFALLACRVSERTPCSPVDKVPSTYNPISSFECGNKTFNCTKGQHVEEADMRAYLDALPVLRDCTRPLAEFADASRWEVWIVAVCACFSLDC